MKKLMWPTYWTLIISSQALMQLDRIVDYAVQPSLNSLYVGNALLRGILIFAIALTIFISANAWTFFICMQRRKWRAWTAAFISSIIFIVLSSALLSEFNTRFLPLAALEKSAFR